MRFKVAEYSSEKPVSHVRIVRGVMWVTREERASKTYTIDNSDTAPRQALIEHPVRSEWKLVDGVKPEETTPSLYRFLVKVDPKASAQLKVEEYHPLTTMLELTNLGTNYIDLFTEQKRMTPAMEQAFKRVLDQKAVIAGLDAQIGSSQQEVASITADQGRLRENMKALKGTPEEKALLQRYTRQLDEQEDRLAALHAQIAGLQTKRQQASQQLDQILAEISLDESF